MNGGTVMVADRVLQTLAEGDGAGVVMLASTEDGCGGYGRVFVDPWRTIEVRMFGWPMLKPGHADESPKAVGVMLRLGFVFDGDDWVWRREFVPALVPVAAHAANRAVAEAWKISPEEATRMVDVHALDAVSVALVVAGEWCDRCVGPCRLLR